MAEELKRQTELFNRWHEDTFDYVDHREEECANRWESWCASLRAQLHSQEGEAVALTVWCGPMPESNGKSNFTAVLMRKGADLFDGLTGGITIERSEYPDRVRYEADRMRYLIGELDAEPDILAYDPDKHSGYTRPADQVADGVVVPRALLARICARPFDVDECMTIDRGSAVEELRQLLADSEGVKK